MKEDSGTQDVTDTSKKKKKKINQWKKQTQHNTNSFRMSD